MARKYTPEFIEEAVKLVTELNYTQAEAGRSLGVSDKNINRWVKNSKVPQGTEKKQLNEQDEIKRLKKEIARLQLEREILKKATAFFANEHN